MRYFIRLICPFLYAHIISVSVAQTLDTKDYPVIGKPLAAFTLKAIQYDKRKKADLKDFSGKWLVLDFFSAGCASCFESFPKINEMKEAFEGDVEFILIGRGDKYTKPAYEKARERLNLKIPVMYDSGNRLFSRFGITSVPHLIVLDREGIIQAVTAKINREDINQFLNGNNPNLKVKLNAQEENKRIPYENTMPLLINGNGGSDTSFLFRSVLSVYNGIRLNNQDFVSSIYFGNKVQFVGLPLIALYNHAYGDTLFHNPDDRGSSYGKYWNNPILELNDSTKFQFSWDSNENRYNYSLIVPQAKASTPYLQGMMQRDLEGYFGYSVNIETRLMPCWKLITTEHAKKKLTSKTPISEKEFPVNGGFVLKDRPVSILIEQLWLYHQMEPPFIDETGISENISIEVDALLTDFNDFSKSLKRGGLELVKDRKEMKVIIIRDPINKTGE